MKNIHFDVNLSVEDRISVEEILFVEVKAFVIFSIVGESVFRRSRNDDSLDGEKCVWSFGSSLSCKEEEFRTARLSIIATEEVVD